MTAEFDRAYWEDRYRGHGSAGPPMPNAHLLSEAQDLAPGRALDAGCGAGGNATWLAERGWRVTAVDISAGALDRARVHAESLSRDVADRLEWLRADLTDWTPAAGHFDLVTAHYVHPSSSYEGLVRRLAAAVAPGGTLLIVDHAPAADPVHAGQGGAPLVRRTGEEITAALDDAEWEIVVAERRCAPEGVSAAGAAVHEDVVVRARARR